jgi:hypothetical protein
MQYWIYIDGNKLALLVTAVAVPGQPASIVTFTLNFYPPGANTLTIDNVTGNWSAKAGINGPDQCFLIQGAYAFITPLNPQNPTPASNVYGFRLVPYAAPTS